MRTAVNKTSRQWHIFRLQCIKLQVVEPRCHSACMVSVFFFSNVLLANFVIFGIIMIKDVWKGNVKKKERYF